MTYTVISDGDDGLVTPVMNNFVHVGRLGMSSFYPMNSSGVYAVQDLGETGKEWGDAYFASGKKIYIGGVEFKGGGGGSSLEILEQKSHLEKSGINYPISMTDGMNESFIDSTNVVITPRVTYASGTTFIADYNKTDVDLMNATTGWTAGTNTPTVAQDTTNKIEGTGSVKMTKTSLNGSIDMYKTFTAFSLVDQLLTFSFYPDTITNVTRFYVKIESSASNDKTYYVPVANITAAAWNHISIDVTNDTADASTGTLVPGSITKVYFGYTTSSSQTVNVSVDFIVYQPNWILPLPASLYIWDGTNQERIAIASVAGTANHQRRTYTITALSNGYAVGAAYAKERNVTIANNQGVFPTGLSGAVALTVYDQTTEHLPTSLAGKTLTMSQRFWDEEFKISSLPSTTSTKLSSATDKKAYFKTGDKVILYHKRYEGRKYNSRYNATAGKNFIIITLTSDATFSSSEITLAHTGEVNSGADTSYWYAVRYSAEMLYKLESETDAGALSTLTPTVFLPKNGFVIPTNATTAWLLQDSAFIGKDEKQFASMATNGTPTPGIINNVKTWTFSTTAYLSYTPTGTNPLSQIYNYSTSTGKCTILALAQLNGADTAGYRPIFQVNNTNGTASNDQPFLGYTENYFRCCMKHTAAVGWGGGAKANAAALAAYNDNNLHFIAGVIDFVNSSATDFSLYIDATLINAINDTAVAAVATTGGSAIGRFGSSAADVYPGQIGGVLFLKDYAMTPTEISTFYSMVRQHGWNFACYVIRGSVDNLTGSKLTTATKLTRQDTTNQNPIIYQRSAILS